MTKLSFLDPPKEITDIGKRIKPVLPDKKGNLQFGVPLKDANLNQGRKTRESRSSGAKNRHKEGEDEAEDEDEVDDEDGDRDRDGDCACQPNDGIWVIVCWDKLTPEQAGNLTAEELHTDPRRKINGTLLLKLMQISQQSRRENL